MKATLLVHEKNILQPGHMVEMIVWKVPTPVPPTEHGFKYRLVYLIDGLRVLGFDNERGKGDHMHIDDREFPYTFVSVDQLIADFITAIERRR